MEQQHSSELFSLQIDPFIKSNLLETARWAKFLAIVGMIVLVLLAIAYIVGFSFLNTVGGVDNSYYENQFPLQMRIGMIIGSIIMIAIAFFPLLYLLQFSNRMKTAMAANDQEALATAFLNLKKYFRYIGILVIIALALYALIFVIAILGFAAFR